MRSKIDGWWNLSKVDGKIVGIKGHRGSTDNSQWTIEMKPTSTKFMDSGSSIKSTWSIVEVDQCVVKGFNR